jgi:cold shock CspA family protein
MALNKGHGAAPVGQEFTDRDLLIGALNGIMALSRQLGGGQLVLRVVMHARDEASRWTTRHWPPLPPVFRIARCRCTWGLDVMAELFYGAVKFYDSGKRFGFIGRDHPGAADVFVGDCGRGLHAGDEVTFHIEIEKRRAATRE